MPILVVSKLLLGYYIKCMPVYRIKKVPSKNIIFWNSVDIIRSK